MIPSSRTVLEACCRIAILTTEWRAGFRRPRSESNRIDDVRRIERDAEGETLERKEHVGGWSVRPILKRCRGDVNLLHSAL